MYSLSITLLTLKYFGLISLPWWQCLAPAGFAFVVGLIFAVGKKLGEDKTGYRLK